MTDHLIALAERTEALCDCGAYSIDLTEHAEYCAYKKTVMEEKP